MFTLNTIERHAVCYGIVKLKQTKDPRCGIRETDVSCTLDLHGGYPCCEQGGWL